MKHPTNQALFSSDTRIAFVQAGWHKEIVEQSRLSFTHTLANSGMHSNTIELFEVPGSLEIPLQCKLLAQSAHYNLIVAAGLIVDGGIYRHDFVASTVLDGIMSVQLETEVPILSIVLTPHHFNEQKEHQHFFFDHFKIKGTEAANAAIQVLQNKKQKPALDNVA